MDLQTGENRQVELSDEVMETAQRIYGDERVQAALAFIEQDAEQTLRDQITLTEIPAPSFQESTRGEYFRELLQTFGLADIQTDAEGNVFGTWRGSGSGSRPTVFICAHLDTVFPAGTDTKVREKEGVYYAPGISDDGRGLATVLGVLRALQESGISTVGDVIFGATVGEEGLGDLRGVKAFFRDHDDVDGFISIEPGDPTRTTYLATGSRRYKVTFAGPGGHSFGAFGTPSAIHALGRAVSLIADVQVPSEPKTTFTVGEIRGGTSVNTIAAEASLMLDMRSNSMDELANLEAEILSRIQEAVDAENVRWGSNAISVEMKLVGDRPAGAQASDARIVQAAMAATRSMGMSPELDGAMSTDSNVPISLGIPAVTLGGGGIPAGMHTLQESFDPVDAHLGVQRTFLALLGLVGVSGLTEPLLSHD
ncbi:M20/M25/M40 family metallo-hydrolase [Alicyclobacillus ferrooxydans]|uniref:Peptidase M20 n=1 Tax=Alicyclobacillus ferrooxydans TaxID=471514 RepID=A0A0P9F084_9BACL|nr:M20/M25/M40 family metallo-hydrolase [Alicyclobacillus ferrooxydans]KPV44744.1 peptidase M20 [Alicyclobacillus ferrooxydans]